MKSVQRMKLQAALEQTSNYAFETGDISVYSLPSYKTIKRQLVEEIKAEKQRNGSRLQPKDD